jgi:hypothetical protein
MGGFGRALFSREIFLPRGQEYLWTPGLLALEGGASLLLAVAWLTAAASVASRALRRRPPPTRRTRILLGVALAAVAVAHGFDAWLIWAPLYWLDSMLRSAAAVLAAGAAIASITDRGDP